MKRKGRERVYWAILLAFSAGATALAALLALVLVDTFPPRPGRDAAVRFERRGAYYVASHSHMIRQPFLAEKPKDVFRVFVLGGSQAMGAPYVSHDLAVISYAAGLLKVPNEGGLSTWLSYYLAPAVPGRRVEVINACLYAHDLRASVENLEWIVAHGSPDLVVVMGGDNEREGEGNHFGDYVRQKSRAAYEALLEKLAAGYAADVDRIVASAEKARVPVYVLTVADNLRDWTPVDEPDFDAAAVAKLVQDGDCEGALRALRGGDPANALRLYYTAKCRDRMGRTAEALRLYTLAKDNDKSFIRARSRWNELIRRRTRGRYARMLDAERFVISRAADGIPGFDVFWDYCHFRLPYNKLLARWIAESFARERGLPADVAARIAAVEPPDLAGSNVRLLYLLKELQWVRLGFYRAFAGSGALNSAHVAQEYQRARRDYRLISHEIGFQKEDRSLSSPD